MKAGPPRPLLCPQCQVGLHSHTVAVNEGAAGLRDNRSEPKDSLGSSVCWAGLPPSDRPPLESGGKLLRAAGACPIPVTAPSPGTHFDLDLFLHFLTLHGCVLLLESAEERAAVAAVPPGGPCSASSLAAATDLFIFLGLYLTW